MYTLPTTLTTYEHYMQYWENIAESLPSIAHRANDVRKKRFFTDLVHLTGIHLNGLVMVAMPGSGGYQNENFDNIHELNTYHIYLLKAAGKSGEQKIRECIEDCRAAYSKILSKLIYDSNAGASPRYFSFFRISQVSFNLVDDPLFADGWVGVQASIPMGNANNFRYDANDWT